MIVVLVAFAMGVFAAFLPGPIVPWLVGGGLFFAGATKVLQSADVIVNEVEGWAVLILLGIYGLGFYVGTQVKSHILGEESPFG